MRFIFLRCKWPHWRSQSDFMWLCGYGAFSLGFHKTISEIGSLISRFQEIQLVQLSGADLGVIDLHLMFDRTWNQKFICTCSCCSSEKVPQNRRHDLRKYLGLLAAHCTRQRASSLALVHICFLLRVLRECAFSLPSIC